ncbi:MULTISPECIES: ABC transporter ATP-binding protein [Pseudomonas]|uniref:ABC transporter ATP-binding protein n=1 Tax=Pseudomonas TaxID=286 RepID=UPI0030039391
MSSDVTIKVDNLSKCYQVYEQPVDRLKQFVLPKLQRVFRGSSEKYYREFWALNDVSFEVRKGETVGIVGRNGSGKSTLLQVICGTLQPTAGSVTTSGRIAALLELGSGFNPEFSGRENVYMNAGILGLTKQEIDERYDAIIDFADIGAFIEQPVKTYSSGMYVRLAFAVIANVDADILIVDEALAVGDIFFTQKCMRFLTDFKKKGTILFVTHDTNSVMSLCDRAVWLDHGKRLAYDKSKYVCEAYLAEFYASSISVQPTETSSLNQESSGRHAPSQDEFRDFRQDFINASCLRNDIEVFKFNDSSQSFGTKSAYIIEAYLASPDGVAAAWYVGGELVQLHIKAYTDVVVNNPIVGFLVKDKNGQHLFGDNTYLSFSDRELEIPGSTTFNAMFEFRMPTLPAGDYTIGVAIAEGTQKEHVIHSWVHDALAFKSHSSSVSTGLVGIPMKKIELKVNE